MSSGRERPDPSEYAAFYAGYVALVPDGDILGALQSGAKELGDAMAPFTEERGGYRYAPGKWSVREVIGHVIDTERIFSYRLLRIARGDVTPLPGFEENAYVLTAGSDARSLADLSAEFGVVRAGTLMLAESLPDGAPWSRMGTASGQPVSVRALAYIAAGHLRHHIEVLRERYSSVS